MISASEARRISDEQSNSKVLNEMRQITSDIASSAKTGCRHIYVYQPLLSKTQEELKKLGYLVQHNTSRNELTITISW